AGTQLTAGKLPARFFKPRMRCLPSSKGRVAGIFPPAVAISPPSQIGRDGDRAVEGRGGRRAAGATVPGGGILHVTRGKMGKAIDPSADRRHLRRAHVFRAWAAGAEAATGGRIARIGWITRE